MTRKSEVSLKAKSQEPKAALLRGFQRLGQLIYPRGLQAV